MCLQLQDKVKGSTVPQAKSPELNKLQDESQTRLWWNALLFPGTVRWHALKKNPGGGGWQVRFQSWSVFFKSSEIYLHLLVSRARALVGNYPEKWFTFDSMKRGREIVRFPQRGMKEASRVPSKWQLNPGVSLRRGDSSSSQTVQPLSHESHSHVQICDCVLARASLSLCALTQVSTFQSPWRWGPIAPGTCRGKRRRRRVRGGPRPGVRV